MKEFDFVIIGGGCAGLSLAYELETHKKLENKTLAIIEPRYEYKRDKTWSFWKVTPHNFEDCVKKSWDNFDVMIHSLAFAPTEELKGSFVESVTREGFETAHKISSYSFAAMAREAKPMLNENASLLTMTYLGSVKSIPNYNVMGPAKASLESIVRFLAADLGPEGIRVNAVSAGPIKTLAAAGVGGMRGLLKYVSSINPIGRNITIEDVGNTAAFLSSDLAAGITGETIYVDGGYRNLGMTFKMD